MTEKTGVVYTIVDVRHPEDILYVGSTVQPLRIKWSDCKREHKTGSRKLCKHMLEHGFEHFAIQPHQTVQFTSGAELRKCEEEARQILKPTLNMNACWAKNQKEIARKYYQRHRLTVRAKQKAYYKRNRLAHIEYVKAYYHRTKKNNYVNVGNGSST